MTDRPDMSGRFFCTRSPPRLPPPETLHATSLQCPRLRLASGSLTRQLGGGSATYASTVALIFLVIPASEPESWAAFCVVLRCAIASLVFILACASLLDSGSSPE